MNGKLTVSLLLLMLASLARCSDNPATSSALPDEVTPTEVMSDISKTFVIAFNHTVLIEDENLLVRFQDVMESRCPVGVQCFWEGQAIAEFLLMKPRGARGIAKPVIRPGVGPDSDEFERLADEALGYRVFLLELNPYPHIDRPADLRHYAAKLRIEKLPGH